MTQLTDAPELVLLQDLSKGWRKVCHMEGERHVWYGDLRTLALRKVYQDMIPLRCNTSCGMVSTRSLRSNRPECPAIVSA
jgi:hypothetical protein